MFILDGEQAVSSQFKNTEGNRDLLEGRDGRQVDDSGENELTEGSALIRCDLVWGVNEEFSGGTMEAERQRSLQQLFLYFDGKGEERTVSGNIACQAGSWAVHCFADLSPACTGESLQRRLTAPRGATNPSGAVSPWRASLLWHINGEHEEAPVEGHHPR